MKNFMNPHPTFSIFPLPAPMLFLVCKHPPAIFFGFLTDDLNWKSPKRLLSQIYKYTGATEAHFGVQSLIWSARF